MRKTSINMVYELAKQDPRVVFIGSDLAPGILDDMRRDFPDRFYMEGVCEQNVIGMAAGLAMNGFIPYINTIATFLTRRCYEQLALDVCLHHLPIRLIGSGGGFVYAPLGPTHLAVEDFAILRALPTMAVAAVCDADEMRRLMQASLTYSHPLYIRLAKGGETVISDPAHGFEIGRAITLREAEGPRPIVIFSTGIMTHRALAAAEFARERHIACRVIHMHTVKPLDTAAILAAAADAAAIITLEEHTLVGGFGSAIVEVLVDNDAAVMPIRRMGVPDMFAKHYGSQDDLLETFGLQPHHILETMLKLDRKRHEKASVIGGEAAPPRTAVRGASVRP